MEWLFIAALSLGPLALVPPLIRAYDGDHPSPHPTGTDGKRPTRDSADAFSVASFAGSALTALGLAGLVLVGLGLNPSASLTAAVIIGLAAGAMYPEVHSAVAGRGRSANSSDSRSSEAHSVSTMDNLMPSTDLGERSVSDSVAEIEARLDGYQPPAAFAVGVATIGPSGAVLDVLYPHVNLTTSWGSAAILAEATGYRTGAETFQLGDDLITGAIGALESIATADGPNTNLEAWRLCAEAAQHEALGGQRVVVASLIDNLYQPPVDTIDVYLRLHLLSHRAVKPNGVNLNGVFGHLNTVVWTTLGPFEPDDFNLRRVALRAMGHEVGVHLVDKFPRMLDYVVPTGVRVADANRVRLGAHLAEGTTVMHEGYCNFNAGTLGTAMVEGRISAGVVVGENSDIGGGASIMGTLSGGGTEVVSIGERCLLGANGGVGISLGDDCIVEAGCYITAGTRITFPDGEVVKGRDISGASGLLFRRNSETGQIQAIPRKNAGWTGLNEALHAN